MKSFMKIAFISALTLICMCLWTAPGAAQVSGGGQFLKNKFIAHDATETTTSGQWASIPSTGINFNTTKRSRVRVIFSAEVWCSPGILHVRARLNGNEMPPGDVYFEIADPSLSTSHTFTWMSGSKVSPGSHEVDIQFRTDGAGSPDCDVKERITSVDFFK